MKLALALGCVIIDCALQQSKTQTYVVAQSETLKSPAVDCLKSRISVQIRDKRRDLNLIFPYKTSVFT